MVAILVTAGIVFVLASEASGFFRGVACGHPEPDLPGHWEEPMRSQILDAASRDGACIGDWNREAVIDVAEPVSSAAWLAGRSSVSLGELEANEVALDLPSRTDGLAREWFVVTWAGEDGTDTPSATALALAFATLLLSAALLVPSRWPARLIDHLAHERRHLDWSRAATGAAVAVLVAWLAQVVFGLPSWLVLFVGAILAGLGVVGQRAERLRGLPSTPAASGAAAGLALLALPGAAASGLLPFTLGVSLVLMGATLRMPLAGTDAPARRAALVSAARAGWRRGLAWAVLAVTLLLSFLVLTAEVSGAVGEFLFQSDWQTTAVGEDARGLSPSMHFGVNALLSATLKVALGALLIAVPLGIASAVYMSEYARPRARAWLKPTIELLAGVPSVVYGFFAIIVLAPLSVEVGTWLFGNGWIDAPPDQMNTVTAGIVVGIMILPLIASLSEDALRAVPRDLREASLALGATRLETTTRVVIPAGLSGIVASVILALSRAVGETMAVTLAVGTVAAYTGNPFVSSQTMTSFIAQKVQGEASKGTLAYSTVFAVGSYLFALTLTLNLLGNRILARFREAVA